MLELKEIPEEKIRDKKEKRHRKSEKECSKHEKKNKKPKKKTENVNKDTKKVLKKIKMMKKALKEKKKLKGRKKYIRRAVFSSLKSPKRTQKVSKKKSKKDQPKGGAAGPKEVKEKKVKIAKRRCLNKMKVTIVVSIVLIIFSAVAYAWYLEKKRADDCHSELCRTFSYRFSKAIENIKNFFN